MGLHCRRSAGGIIFRQTIADDLVFFQCRSPASRIFKVACELGEIWVDALVEQVPDYLGHSVVAQNIR